MLTTTQTGAIAVGLCIAVSVGLSGCAPESPAAGLGEYPNITLAESKSPVQFLRNDAAARLPEKLIDEITGTRDESISCLPEEEDAAGLIRSWQSTAILHLKDTAAPTIDKVVDDLAETFVQQGWKLSTSGDSALVNPRTLTSETSTAQLEIKATTDDPDAIYGKISKANDVSVVIVAHGPCVVTDGAQSPQVMKLEKKKTN